MAEKLVKDITSMDEDFAKWYTDIVLKAELVDYSSVKGCVVFRPYSYAIWENIQKDLDARFKATGHENVYMPMFISESLLQKEKDHVEGFAPEVAGKTMRQTDFRNAFLRTLFTYYTFAQRSAETLQPMVQRCALGKDDASFPAFERVPVAGRTYGARDRGRGNSGNGKNA